MLDRLAQVEADTAPPDLTHRLARATWPSLRGQGERLAEDAHRHSRRRRIRRMGVALAASLGVVATALFTVVAMRPPARPEKEFASVDFAREFDLLLTLTSDHADLGTEVDLLVADTATLEADVDDSFWTLLDVEESL